LPPVWETATAGLNRSIQSGRTARLSSTIVIRHYFEDDFKKKIGNNFDGLVETAYAYQELDAALDGFALPPDREKPWGTGHATLLGRGHATLLGRDFIDEPFAVINADDYYGIDSFKMMADFLRSPEVSPTNYAMVAAYVTVTTIIV